MKLNITVPLIFLLLLSLAACSERTSNEISSQSSVEEQGDELVTAQLEESLMASVGRISERQLKNSENESVSELEKLSEADRQALQAIASGELMQAAEQKALKQAQDEAKYRSPDQ
ncbi:MAG: hypothetical protein ACI9FR_000435 [Cryomorphaceae bacterium]|jgi:hypothetical protein